MSKCDVCGKETEVKEYKITDNMGTRYRMLCEECAAKLSAGEEKLKSKVDAPNEKAEASSELVINQNPVGSEDIMFGNIGSKLKTVAKVFCIMGIVISVLYAIVLWMSSSQYNNNILTGVIVLIGGCLISWVSSLGVYGFGEMIDKVSKIEYILAKKK